MELFIWLCLVKYALVNTNVITNDYVLDIHYQDCANWEINYIPKWSSDFDEEGNRELIKRLQNDN